MKKLAHEPFHQNRDKYYPPLNAAHQVVIKGTTTKFRSGQNWDTTFLSSIQVSEENEGFGI